MNDDNRRNELINEIPRSAGHNTVAFLPDSIGNLASLLVLDVRNNKLRSIPASIASLTLSMLDLSNNDLASVPPELGRMTSLRSLRLEGNPLRTLPQHVVSGMPG